MMTLSAYLTETGTTPAEFARLIGRHRSNVLRLARGDTQPDLALAFRIETVTQGAVPVAAWRRAESHDGQLGPIQGKPVQKDSAA